MKKLYAVTFLFAILISINSIIFAKQEIEIPENILVKMGDNSIVEVDFDEYLYSVVQSEMGTSYKAVGMKNAEAVPLEALKAQAVASRSFALHYILAASDDADFHITSSSQTYKQNIDIKDIVKQAVDETSGQLITYDDKVACGYFYATSGGHTEASENVWTAELPHVKGVKDKYEIEIENESNWEAVYTQAELKDIFPNIGNIRNIEIEELSENDRVTKLKIVGSKGTETLTKNNIRSKLGSRKLKSQWFDVEFDGDAATFEGKGFGHGVGMSQNGAIGMGIEGFSYDEILTWYYTDVEIYGLEKKKSSSKDEENETFDEKSNDYETYEDYDEEEIKEIETPLLDTTIGMLTKNWLLDFLMRTQI